MKEKTALLILDGYQVALGAIMLVCVTVGFLAHLFKGHLGPIGFVVGAFMWYIVYSMFIWSVRDYKKTKNSKEPSND